MGILFEVLRIDNGVDVLSEGYELPIEGVEDGEMGTMLDKSLPSALEAGPVKKQRKQRLRIGMGIGGFIARPRASKTAFKHKAMIGSAKAGLAPLPIQFAKPALEGEEQGDDPTTPETKKRRARRWKKKSQLEDNYPGYLQEAFFGKGLLDESRIDRANPMLNAPPDDDDKNQPASPTLKSTLDGAGDNLMFTSPTMKQAQPSTSADESDKEGHHLGTYTSILCKHTCTLGIHPSPHHSTH